MSTKTRTGSTTTTLYVSNADGSYISFSLTWTQTSGAATRLVVDNTSTVTATVYVTVTKVQKTYAIPPGSSTVTGKTLQHPLTAQLKLRTLRTQLGEIVLVSV